MKDLSRRIYQKPRSILFVLFFALLAQGQSHAQNALKQSVPSIENIRIALEGTTPPASYKMYALRVGIVQDARRNLFIRDPALPRRIPAAFSLWVLKSTERTILIDSGFINRSMVKKWGVEQYHTPLSLLSKIGIAAKQVTDIIVTHNHWDHMGAVHQFPRARLWISLKTYRDIGGRRPERLPRAFRRAQKQGRLNIIKGVTSIAPSVVVVPVGLHTPGFQFVAVKTSNGNVVFASDVAPLYANFKRKKATGQTSDPSRTLAVQQLMLDLTKGKLNCIVPGHDPGIYNNGPIAEITPGAEK